MREIFRLSGKPAPKYKKLDRKVFYIHAELDQWLSDIPEYSNTAQAGKGV